MQLDDRAGSAVSVYSEPDSASSSRQDSLVGSLTPAATRRLSGLRQLHAQVPPPATAHVHSAAAHTVNGSLDTGLAGCDVAALDRNPAATLLQLCPCRARTVLPQAGPDFCYAEAPMLLVCKTKRAPQRHTGALLPGRPC